VTSENCKHGLMIGTCAYCSGLIKKPSMSGTSQFGVQFVKDGSSIFRYRGAVVGSYLDENPDKGRGNYDK
jgi:hypothetical protein